jgi:hypothetical protein
MRMRKPVQVQDDDKDEEEGKERDLYTSGTILLLPTASALSFRTAVHPQDA